MRHNAALLEYDDVGHGFFGRAGGVSSGVYSTLNCGPGSSDDPDAVQENRKRVMYKIAGAEQQLVTLNQIHSAEVVTVSSAWNVNDRPKADAMVTRQKNIGIGILTADCCPILFADNENGVIGAAHAGWRGAIAGVIPNTIKAMQQIGAQIGNIRAAIGPTIQQASYEVGADVYEAFTSADAANERLFKPSTRTGFYMLDLPGFVIRALRQSGIQLYENLAMDTYPAENDFFSYRRRTHETHGAGGADYGRQVSAIILR